MKLRAAYPYFGSKAAIADELWEAFGVEVANFVDPFCGSASVLLARPAPGKIETVNDAHAFIPNFLRAVRDNPEAVADWATWPVSEIDMHARHDWLLTRADETFVEQLREDPEFYDAQVAGWWVWGASIWIGSGWCDDNHNSGKTQRRQPRLRGRDGEAQSGVGLNREPLTDRRRPALSGGTTRKRPQLAGHHVSGERDGYPKEGVGIFRSRLPRLIGPHHGRKDGGGEGVGYGRGIFASERREDLRAYFRALAERLARVRITCGDWSRVVTPAVTISHGTTAILLDPPYGEGAGKRAKLYAEDSLTISADVRAWAVEHGEDRRYRIALCGYEGEHEMPSSWRVLAWKTNGGYGNQDRENANASKERVWFSPHCLGGERVAGPLFERLAGGVP